MAAKKFKATTYYEKESKQEIRERLLKAILEQVNVSKGGRLMYLLGKGMKAVKEEAKKEDEMTYEIFKDDFVAFSDGKDMPPNQITKTVRMSKVSRPTAQTFTPNGKYLILGMQDGFIEVWSPKTKSLALDIIYQNDEIFMQNEKEVTYLVSNKSSSFVAAADISKKVNVWKIEKGTIVKSFENTHSGSISVMLFNPGEDNLVTASTDIKVWGMKSGRKINELIGHEAIVTGLEYFEDHLMSSSLDGTIRVWNLKTGKEKIVMRPFTSDLPRIIGISAFSFVSEDRILLCPESNCFSVVDIDGKEVSKGQVVMFKARSTRKMQTLWGFLCQCLGSTGILQAETTIFIVST